MTTEKTTSVAFDAAAWVAAAEAALVYPQLAFSNGVNISILMPYATAIGANQRQKDILAKINEPKDGFAERLDAVSAFLSDRGDKFDARAWLKRKRADGFEFLMTGEWVQRVTYNGPPLTHHPITGLKFYEPSTTFAVLQGDAPDFYRYQQELGRALEIELESDEMALPFVRVGGRKKDKILSYWAPKPTGEVLRDMDLGRKYALAFLRYLRKDWNSLTIGNVMRDLAKQQAKRGRCKDDAVRGEFLRELYGIIQNATRDDFLMRSIAERIEQPKREKAKAMRRHARAVPPTALDRAA